MASSGSRLFGFLKFLAVIIPAFYIFSSFSPRFHRFDPVKLQEISKAAIAKHGDDVDSLFRMMVDDLKVEYPGIIEDYDPSRFVFNVAGGATGSMIILHASITEYLIFFGSASGTEGHSGVHMADDYFTILAGQQTAGFLGELKPRVYLPGDQHHHPRGTSAHYKMEQSSWALELAQGFIPGMLPFGLVQMPMIFDIDSLWRTVWYTGKSTTLNLLKGKI